MQRMRFPLKKTFLASQNRQIKLTNWLFFPEKQDQKLLQSFDLPAYEIRAVFFGKPSKWMYAWPSILHIFCIFMDFWQPSTNSNRWCGGVAIPVVAGFQQGTIRENWQWEYFGNNLVMNTKVMLKRKKEFKIEMWSGRIKLISFQF